MKITKKVLQILILYFSIFFVLFTALYLMMPFYFNSLYMFLNMYVNTLLLFISLFLIYKKSKKKEHKACDTTYFICKNIPITLHFLGVLVSLFIIITNKNSTVISLISMFGWIVFYIFSQRFFKEILSISESELRPKTTSLTDSNIFSPDLSESTNLLIQIIPLFINVILLNLDLQPSVFACRIYSIATVIISILCLINISLNYYKNVNELSNDNYEINYNNEFGELAYRINTTKQIYSDYIDELKDVQNKELEKQRLASIEIIRRTVDAKDTYTRGHSDRVSSYSVLIGEKLGLSKEDLQTIKIGGLFHDIGKIGIPDKVLLKDGKLTDEEYDEIKKHPSIGAHILENSQVFEKMIPIVLHHHEKFDGRGYPEGLKGEDIPLMARIVAVADTFDAMTSKRVYRNSLPLDVVRAEFERCSGSQFDPEIAEVFINILNNEYNKIEEIMKL